MTDKLTARMVRLYGPPHYLSLAEIGARCGGVSRQAVQKRLARAGVERRDSAGARALRYDTWAASHVKSIERALARTRDPVELAAALKVPVTWTRRYLEARFGTALVVPNDRPQEFTDAELIEALQSAHRMFDNSALALSATMYEDNKTADAPTAATMVDRFGSWAAACTAAEVPANGTLRHYTPVWDAADVLAAVRAYTDDCRAAGRRPTALDYDRSWRSEHDCPSLATVRKHFGSWRAALCEALL